MTKQQFENNKKPLALIVSLNLKTGKVLYDTYVYETSQGWYDEMKQDFPDMIHFIKVNKAATEARKKALGLTG